MTYYNNMRDIKIKNIIKEERPGKPSNVTILTVIKLIGI